MPRADFGLIIVRTMGKNLLSLKITPMFKILLLL